MKAVFRGGGGRGKPRALWTSLWRRSVFFFCGALCFRFFMPKAYRSLRGRFFENFPRRFSSLRRLLFARGVYRVIFPIDKLADGDELIAAVLQGRKDQGKRLRRMQPVIVAENDGAGLDAVDDAHGDVGGGKIFPIQRIHVPLNGINAHRIGGVDEEIVVIAVGRSEKLHFLARHGGDRRGGGFQLGTDLAFALLAHIGVRLAVRADLVSRLVDLFDVFGILFRHLT